MRKIFAFLLVFIFLFSCIIPINIISVSAAGPTFPYNATYAAGLSSQADDQNAANVKVKAEWEEWKTQRITTNGAGGFKRVQRDSSSSYDTVSEGMGYGMLLSVYFDEQALFDDLFKYSKAHFNANGLLGWHMDSSGKFTTTDGGSGAATDADEDMALSLIFASKKWGAGSINYETEARAMVNAVYSKEVEAGTNVLKPGDSWGGSSVTNPSYFAPAYYRVFAGFTGNSAWNSVASKCYEILAACRNNNANTGLIPDWCTSNGTKAASQGYDFKYDAIRTPWRIAVDYSWYGTTQAKTICDDISKFFSNAGVSSIGDGYTITGSKISNNHSTSFVSMIASGSMTGYSTTFAKAMYNENLSVKDPAGGSYSYFGSCLRMFALMHTTGNFPNLYNFTPTSPSPSPTSTQSPSPSPSPSPSVSPSSTKNILDVNSDGAINMSDVMILALAFNSVNGDNRYSQLYDLNKDGAINMTDIMMIAVKFNTVA